MSPKTIIAGNWKMNLSLEEAKKLVCDLEKNLNAMVFTQEVVLCPTFLQLPIVAPFVQKTKLGAQDVYFEVDGAFTGEVSTGMLKEVGATYVIVGHSERRHILLESNETVGKKMTKVLNDDLTPIFCVGEKIEERKNKQTLAVIKNQLEVGLKGLNSKKAAKIVLAYEPVWAIGTGLNATRHDAEEVIDFIRNYFKEKYGEEISLNLSILYGGSVKPRNIKEFAASEKINGVLVGGASLKAEEFSVIMKAYL